MFESKAISPKVKQLFEKVNQNAELYLSIVNKLQEEFDGLKEDRKNIKFFEEKVIQNVNEITIDLKTSVKDSISELDQSSKKAMMLHNELGKIQELKENLSFLQQKLSSQSKDIITAVEELKNKSDRELKELEKTIEYRLETDLEKESQKIDARISLKVKQLENKISSYDQKIYSLNTNQIRDSKIAIYEIEKLKKDFIELKAVVDESQQNLMNDFDNFEGEFRKKLYNYEMRFKDLSKKMEGMDKFDVDISAKVNKDDTIIESKGLNKNLIIDKEIKKLGNVIKDYTNIKESITDSIALAEKKANIAMFLSIISLVGVVLILILYSL